ncbi:hypothetical protein [Burkholderia multivorans]|uniref:hypothetical protein n=1 Tax=Burkholderia multivorans TaxID=87883 RepID=UPI0021BEBCA4|nr:hypothetical protein [Burkholderia multivorans]
MKQQEIRIFAPYVEAARLPVAEIESMTFEQCLAKALEMGLTRFDRKTLAKHCQIHYPHFPEFMSGKRKMDRLRLFLFCMFTGCDYPRQWLELAEQKAEAEYKRVSAQMIGEYVQQAFATRAAA